MCVCVSGDVQMAQPAVCKVRTEVMEVTRSMLDRSNANFLLWPLCVEVQRCSGCCNTRTLQCVPVSTETRHLQVHTHTYIYTHFPPWRSQCPDLSYFLSHVQYTVADTNNFFSPHPYYNLLFSGDVCKISNS